MYFCYKNYVLLITNSHAIWITQAYRAQLETSHTPNYIGRYNSLFSIHHQAHLLLIEHKGNEGIVFHEIFILTEHFCTLQ